MPYGYCSYGYGAGLNSSYILLVLVSLALGLATQAYIKKTYRKWSNVRASLPGSGAEVARRMLDEGGASSIGIDRIAGELTDNFGRLSSPFLRKLLRGFRGVCRRSMPRGWPCGPGAKGLFDVSVALLTCAGRQFRLERLDGCAHDRRLYERHGTR